MTSAMAQSPLAPLWHGLRRAPTNDQEPVDMPDAASLDHLESLLESLADVPFAPLVSPLRDALQANRDRLRARIVFAVGRAYGAAPEKSIALAAALETLYAASQVHERLPAVPVVPVVPAGGRQNGVGAAIGALVLMGDHLYAKSAVFAAQAEAPAIVTLFARTLQEISQAQVRHQLQAPNGTGLSANAVLCGAAAEGAALLGNAARSEVQRLREAGCAIGATVETTPPDRGRTIDAALRRVRHPAARQRLRSLAYA